MGKTVCIISKMVLGGIGSRAAVRGMPVRVMVFNKPVLVRAPPSPF
jgi:hypothetical protein